MFADRLKALPGLSLGKMYLYFRRFSRFGGSTLPGRLALGLSPCILAVLASQLKEGCILVTGTNGKTTTAHLLASILSQAGKKVIHNRSGANLISGVTTSFVAESSWLGKVNADFGVIEVDEAAMPAVASRLKVKAVIVTNIFPDQLDRFGGPGHTLDLISRGLNAIAREGFILLNADDPLVSSISKTVPAFYYGIDALTEMSETKGQTDVKATCRRCGEKLEYLHVHYAHLGLYRCPGCGFRRPLPHYSITACQKKSEKSAVLDIKTPGSLLPVSLNIPGFYNLYNALAAVACALRFGIGEAQIKETLRGFAASFGRMEKLSVGGKTVELALIKNSAGANEILRTLADADDEITLMFAINDRYADGTDVSWLWDVDFEILSFWGGKIAKIFCSGSRGEEMSLRLKYAGVDTGMIKYEANLEKTFQEGLHCTPAGGKLQILLTYTAMQELQKIMGTFISAGR